MLRVSPKLGVPFLGVSIVRIIVFWGLYWGSFILGNYQLGSRASGLRFGVYEAQFGLCGLGCRV